MTTNDFKVDFATYKNSSDTSILGKVRDFQKHFSEHERLGLNLYSKPAMLSGCDREVTVLDRFTGEHKQMLMFGSNSYLNATCNDKCVSKSLEVIKTFGVGSGGVPLLSGTTIYQNQLEKLLADISGCDDSILFTSGFTANTGAILGLARPNNLLIYDKLNHASLIDGAIISGAKIMRYLHSNMTSLEKILSENFEQYSGGMMIVTDGVFSMDGDIANMPEIIRLAKKYNALVLIDEAHSTGVIGDRGAGTLSHFGITDRENVIVTGTLSKAIGLVGGYITSSKEIIDYLRIYARSNMYSTSLPPNVCASAIEVIKYMQESGAIERVMANSDYLKSGLKAMGYNILNSTTSLIPVIIGDPYILTSMSKDIFNQGIFVNYIFPPVVPPKLSRIRIGAMSSHTKEDLDSLLSVMKNVGQKYGLLK